MTAKTRRILWVGAVAAVTGAIVVWRTRPPVVDTELAVATRGSLRVTLDEDGEARVLRHVTVSAPVSGRLLETAMRAGDSVSRGDALVTMVAAPLDPRAREQARSALQAADAGVSRARSQLGVAQLALDDAARALSRSEELHRTGAVSDRDLESAQRLRETRQREVDMATEQVKAATAERSIARSALEGSSATSAPSGSRVVVRAPLGGRVLRVFEEHERLVAAGTPLLELGDPRDLEVVVDVLSSEARDIAIGAPMEVRVGEGTPPLAATVVRIEPAAFTKLSPLGVQEQRVDVHGVFSEPPRSLGDAYQVGVSVVLWEGAHVLRVPASALVAADSAGEWVVYRVRAGRAAPVTVRVGHRGTRDVEVESGLAEGDTVVARPSAKIAAGVRVRGVSLGVR
ncbi:MAG TPA: HlyD family efflux transporter periplasmic adaptor subunit [Gemmatimonadaceae bacterium]|nr:HlyD family efflux transporter periplasmic adaptor subunit [Gemmatimonadaceae bacterium]